MLVMLCGSAADTVRVGNTFIHRRRNFNMAGFEKLYVIGGGGGYQDGDGVNPMETLVLVGNSDRDWLEPRYLQGPSQPLGKLERVILQGPNHPDALLDACLAFRPDLFPGCPSLRAVESQLKDADRLDLQLDPAAIRNAWAKLRDEARETYESLKIWQAELAPVRLQSCT
jgi:hypothetical protein